MKVAMENSVRNATMAELKKGFDVFLDKAMWRLLRPIETPVVEPQNEFTVARAPTVSDDSEVQVPVKHNFSDTF